MTLQLFPPTPAPRPFTLVIIMSTCYNHKFDGFRGTKLESRRQDDSRPTCSLTVVILGPVQHVPDLTT